MDQDEYVDATLALMEDLDDDVFDAGVKRVLLAVKFASASRQEELRMVFSHVDTDGSGTLDRDGLDALKSRALVPGEDEEKVRRTMRWLDADGDAEVTFEEFSGPMLWFPPSGWTTTRSTPRRTPSSPRREAREPDPADDLPPRFRRRVSAFPTHATTPQIGVKKAQRARLAKKKIAVVDCRPEEERAVSIIPGSIPLGDVKFADATDNNVGVHGLGGFDQRGGGGSRRRGVLDGRGGGRGGDALDRRETRGGGEKLVRRDGGVVQRRRRRCATRTARRATRAIRKQTVRGVRSTEEKPVQISEGVTTRKSETVPKL